ncbi:hypothetical protein FA95DRAFT_1592300 [Auriscalpium vulgare]|uniref:Uncharacterized protein n=1 Tax=Auriscalpium vulgare TaxID=40419 RepID=A0ACB8S9W7_9AGAM|nr:hypothetical protein FA95DRAFT_1592300 [Auriscalpium vulgare]
MTPPGLCSMDDATATALSAIIKSTIEGFGKQMAVLQARVQAQTNELDEQRARHMHLFDANNYLVGKVEDARDLQISGHHKLGVLVPARSREHPQLRPQPAPETAPQPAPASASRKARDDADVPKNPAGPVGQVPDAGPSSAKPPGHVEPPPAKAPKKHRKKNKLFEGPSRPDTDKWNSEREAHAAEATTEEQDNNASAPVAQRVDSAVQTSDTDSPVEVPIDVPAPAAPTEALAPHDTVPDADAASQSPPSVAASADAPSLTANADAPATVSVDDNDNDSPARELDAPSLTVDADAPVTVTATDNSEAPAPEPEAPSLTANDAPANATADEDNSEAPAPEPEAPSPMVNDAPANATVDEDNSEAPAPEPETPLPPHIEDFLANHYKRGGPSLPSNVLAREQPWYKKPDPYRNTFIVPWNAPAEPSATHEQPSSTPGTETSAAAGVNVTDPATNVIIPTVSKNASADAAVFDASSTPANPADSPADSGIESPTSPPALAATTPASTRRKRARDDEGATGTAASPADSPPTDAEQRATRRRRLAPAPTTPARATRSARQSTPAPATPARLTRSARQSTPAPAPVPSASPATAMRTRAAARREQSATPSPKVAGEKRVRDEAQAPADGEERAVSRRRVSTTPKTRSAVNQNNEGGSGKKARRGA